MRRTRPVRCDRYRCGRAIGSLAGATIYLRFDRRRVLVEAGLHHASCSRMASPPGRIELVAAVLVATDKTFASRLRGLARVPEGASVSRLLRKVERLAALQAAPAPERATEAA